MRRFIHLFPGITRLSGILRTRYNQHDSLILPARNWLQEKGVIFKTGATVTDIEIAGDQNGRCVTQIELADGAAIAVAEHDRVFITLGSMTDASTKGSNEIPPAMHDQPGPAWQLWSKLADRYAGFGHPEAFCAMPEKTAWNSFTITFDNEQFLKFMEELSGNVSGTGGLVTFVDSGWLLSIVVFHQPHFRSQPAGTSTVWGYGLRGDAPGDFTKKPMWEANGDEILVELAGHLQLDEAGKSLLDGARVIPCRMPFITSQFMPRVPGDRPPVRPVGAQNFAVMGQFCELERDCVFTVEYSVRSAWEAVSSLTGACSPPRPVVRTDLNPIVMLRAARSLLLG
jgi:oleate hydratase